METQTAPPVPNATFESAADRAAWLELRKTGIGGSDAAALLGVSRYASPLSLWANKTGQVPDSGAGPAAHWGTVLEPVIATHYAASCEPGVSLLELPQGCYRSKTHHFALATPDRLLVRDGDPFGILEIKTAGSRTAHYFGDEPPVWYQAQVAWYCWVTGLREAKLAALIAGQDYRVYGLPYDSSLDEIFASAGETFWHAVTTRTPPPTDAHEATAKALNDLYRRAADRIVAVDDLADAVTIYTECKAQAAALEARMLGIENALKARMEDATAAEVSGQVVATWREVASERIDTTRLKAEEPEVAARFAKKSVSRRFCWKV